MSDKTYNRNINIYINGKEVANNVAAIRKEMYNLTNQLADATIGTKQYNEKAAELRRVKSILKEHQAEVTATKTAWEKVKGAASSSMGMITAGIGTVMGAYQSLKSVIFSTDELGDKFEVTLAGWKGGFDAIARSIATMDFKNFGKNVKQAIEEARRYAEANDAISDSLRALQFQEAEVSSEIIKAKEIAASALSSKADAIAASQKAIDLEDQLAKIRTDIAKEQYENELTNAASITKRSKQELEDFLRQKPAMLEKLEIGKKYLDIQKRINDYKVQEAASIMPETGTRMLNFSKEIQAAKEEQLALGNMGAEYAKLFNDLGLLVDDKKNKITAAYVAWKQAETSNIENTLRLRIKTDSLLAAKDKAAGKEETEDASPIESYEKSWAEFLKMRKILEKNIEDAYKNLDPMTAEKWQEEADTRVQVEMEVTDKILEQRQKLIEQEKDMFADKVQLYMDYSTAVGGILGQALADEEMTAKEAAKQLLLIAIDALRQYARLAIAQATMKQVAEKGFIGLGTAAILTAVIETALAGAEAVIKKKMYTGGFTGWGGMYEPAGVVHKNEWVANSAMVSSPTFGPMIQALEQVQRGGAGMATGGYPGGAAGGSSGSSLSGSSLLDSKLNNTLTRIERVLTNIDRDGVIARLNFGYPEADGVRNTMNKLTKLESGVSL